MMRLVLSSLRAIGLAATAASVAGALAPASAATTKLAKKDDASKPALVATFGDWNVFVAEAG